MTIATSLGFPQCNFPVISNSSVFSSISDRLEFRKPTSVIRLGDGEGMVLGRPTPDETYLWSHLQNHFGPSVTTKFVDSLAKSLTHAIDSADILGIRDDLLNREFPKETFDLTRNEFTDKFKTIFPLREAERNIKYPAALRLALLHRFLSEHSFRQDAIFASAWSHFGLSQSGDLIRLIATQKYIGLISSRATLNRQLETLLKIKVNFYQIPDIYSQSVIQGNSNSFNQLPAQLTQTLASLKVDFQGQLFLVGAGIIGKVYCDKIKQLGGIAIDIGAVCDAWVGIPSRPLVLQSLYDVPGDKVPSSLLLKHQVENYKE